MPFTEEETEAEKLRDLLKVLQPGLLGGQHHAPRLVCLLLVPMLSSVSSPVRRALCSTAVPGHSRSPDTAVAVTPD